MLNAIKPFRVRWVAPAVGLAAGAALLGMGVVSASSGPLQTALDSAASRASCGFKIHQPCVPALKVKEHTLTLPALKMPAPGTMMKRDPSARSFQYKALVNRVQNEVGIQFHKAAS